MRWHTVLFDLDGTLTDPKEGITRAFAYALRHYGVDADPDGLGCVIGPPLKDSFMELYGFSAQQAVEAIGKYREYYGSRGWAENVPYPGIGRMLAGLNAAGLTLAVATSKPEEFSVRILEHTAQVLVRIHQFLINSRCPVSLSLRGVIRQPHLFGITLVPRITGICRGDTPRNRRQIDREVRSVHVGLVVNTDREVRVRRRQPFGNNRVIAVLILTS